MIESRKMAYVFPGQGSQWVGMGRDLYSNSKLAREIFKQADSILEFPLSNLCFLGPEDELRRTINAQPAIVTVSYACLETIREIYGFLPPPTFCAGHSLGEYTALIAAEVLDFPSTIYLARERGRLMDEAGLVYPGAMIAVIGSDVDLLARVCNETNTWIANINCPGQLVISGEKHNIDRAIEIIKKTGSHQIIPLQVSGAFHTPLMRSVVNGMSKIIRRLEFQNPKIPIIANTTAKPLITSEEVKEELLEQLCGCVQWRSSVEYMINNGAKDFFEIGPGRVLTGLIRRINKTVNIKNIGNIENIKSLGASEVHNEFIK